MRTVVISPQAFIGMVVSSIEVYKKETFGILIGSKKKNTYYASQSINFQSAERHYDYIDIDLKRINRINSILKYLLHKSIVGEFHSHACGPCKLSKHDKQALKEEGGDFVSVLLVINKSKKDKVIKWKYGTKHHSVSGSLGRFHVKLLAYEFDEKKDKVVPVKVKLTNLSDLNKIGTYYKHLWSELEKHKKREKALKVRKRKIKQKLE